MTRGVTSPSAAAAHGESLRAAAWAASEPAPPPPLATVESPLEPPVGSVDVTRFSSAPLNIPILKRRVEDGERAKKRPITPSVQPTIRPPRRETKVPSCDAIVAVKSLLLLSSSSPPPPAPAPAFRLLPLPLPLPLPCPPPPHRAAPLPASVPSPTSGRRFAAKSLSLSCAIIHASWGGGVV